MVPIGGDPWSENGKEKEKAAHPGAASRRQSLKTCGSQAPRDLRRAGHYPSAAGTNTNAPSQVQNEWAVIFDWSLWEFVAEIALGGT